MSDELFVWPLHEAPWSLAKGGTGLPPTTTHLYRKIVYEHFERIKSGEEDPAVDKKAEEARPELNPLLRLDSLKDISNEEQFYSEYKVAKRLMQRLANYRLGDAHGPTLREVETASQTAEAGLAALANFVAEVVVEEETPKQPEAAGPSGAKRSRRRSDGAAGN